MEKKTKEEAFRMMRELDKGKTMKDHIDELMAPLKGKMSDELYDKIVPWQDRQITLSLPGVVWVLLDACQKDMNREGVRFNIEEMCAESVIKMMDGTSPKGFMDLLSHAVCTVMQENPDLKLAGISLKDFDKIFPGDMKRPETND